MCFSDCEGRGIPLPHREGAWIAPFCRNRGRKKEILVEEDILTEERREGHRIRKKSPCCRYIGNGAALCNFTEKVRLQIHGGKG